MSKMYDGDFTEVELNGIEEGTKTIVGGHKARLQALLSTKNMISPLDHAPISLNKLDELRMYIAGMASTIRWLWERNRKTQDDLNAANDAISESPGLNTSIEDCDVDLVYPGEDERQDIRDELDKATNAIALARTKLGR